VNGSARWMVATASAEARPLAAALGVVPTGPARTPWTTALATTAPPTAASAAPPPAPADDDDAGQAALAAQALELARVRADAAAEARREVHAELAPLRSELDTLLRSSRRWFQALRGRQLELMVEAVMVVLETWLPASPEGWRDRLLPALRAWLERTGDPGPLVVAAHPASVDALRDLIGDGGLTFAPDETLTPGDVALRGATSAAEHRWRDALPALRPLVLAMLGEGLPAVDAPLPDELIPPLPPIEGEP
jgi:hypothetical protein